MRWIKHIAKITWSNIIPIRKKKLFFSRCVLQQSKRTRHQLTFPTTAFVLQLQKEAAAVPFALYASGNISAS